MPGDAASLSALADERDRLLAAEAEASRLRAAARATGLRIRGQVRVCDQVREARDALTKHVEADPAYLGVMWDGHLSAPPDCDPWPLPDSVIADLGGDNAEVFRDLLKRQAAMVIQDTANGADPQLSAALRAELAAAGVVSGVLVPFGAGEELLGLIAAARHSHAKPWTDAEVDAVEAIAEELGRAVHHSRLSEAENRLGEQIQAVDRAKSDFLSAVSHELRTPLTSITGYIEILRGTEAGPLTAAQEKMLETVDRNAVRLRQLIEDVLTLSKVESGAFKTMKHPVELASLITSAVSALAPAAAARELSVTCDDVGPGLTVNGDPGQLDRMLMHLLTNAAKFTPPGGQIQVSAGAESGMAVLRVTDTGVGIPEADQEALFTRFFRASNAVDLSIPGTGLGLTIVRTIVANHSGELHLTSAEGKGTTVTVRLPLLAADAETEAPRPVTPAAGGGRRR